MDIKMRLLATILSFVLVVSSFTGIQAKEVNEVEVKVPTVQKLVKDAVYNVANNESEVKVQSVDVAAMGTADVNQSVNLYNKQGKVVPYMTPFHYTKRSQLENGEYSMYKAVIPNGYKDAAVLPIKINTKGALVAAAVNSLGTEVRISSVYADAKCINRIGFTSDFAYLPKAGTYYIKIDSYDFMREQETQIGVVLGFVSGANVEVKSKSYALSVALGKNTPIYFKAVVSKTSKLTFRIDSTYSSNVTLCNSKKSAITSEEFVSASEGRVVYVVPKGTYYLKVKKLQEAFSVSAVYTTVSNAGMPTKAKAGTLKVNGSTRNTLILPGDSTGKTYYMKFYNPKTQKIKINVTSSYTSGKTEFMFLNSKGESYGTRTLYNGLNRKNVYEPYVYGVGYDSKKLPKGTYYIKFKKLDKKTSGIVQVNVKSK